VGTERLLLAAARDALPHQRQLASVVGPQAHGQLPVASECYEYDTVGTRRLTRVFDYKGRLLVENEYENSTQSENFGRVIRQAERAGETMFAYERLLLPTDPTALLARDAATLRVWEYSRNGHEIEHLFNEAGNELMRRQHYVDGCAQRTKITRFRYNADGELVARLAPDGVLIQRLLFRDHLGDRIPWPEEVDVYLGDVDLFDRMSFGNVLATVTRATRLEVDTVEPSRELWETLPATKAPLTTGDEAQKQTYDQADPA
jgi:hypothetical protein